MKNFLIFSNDCFLGRAIVINIAPPLPRITAARNASAVRAPSNSTFLRQKWQSGSAWPIPRQRRPFCTVNCPPLKKRRSPASELLNRLCYVCYSIIRIVSGFSASVECWAGGIFLPVAWDASPVANELRWIFFFGSVLLFNVCPCPLSSVNTETTNNIRSTFLVIWWLFQLREVHWIF